MRTWGLHPIVRIGVNPDAQFANPVETGWAIRGQGSPSLPFPLSPFLSRAPRSALRAGGVFPITNGNTVGAQQDFITGWLQGSSPWGRPVDVLPGKYGELYITDDRARYVYRVVYSSAR
jgi:hypothetical protein